MDAQMLDPDSLLTPAEVAAILYVDPKTVTRWAKAGKLSCFLTPGGHRRFLKSDIHALITGPGHYDGVLKSFTGYAAALAPAARTHRETAQQRNGERTATERGRFAVAASVVAEAVLIAQQADVDEASSAVTLTADAVVAAAAKAARAAETAREGRASAARSAAEAVASDAARTALAMQLTADARAVKVAEAASRAAAIVAAANPPGGERESAMTALRLAATVEAAAVAAAEDTAAAAARIADAVTVAAAGLASTVSAAAVAVESEVAKVAATLQATATTAARQVAADTDARATNAALVAREAATDAKGIEDAWHRDAGAASALGPQRSGAPAVSVAVPLQPVSEGSHRGR